MIFGRFWEPWHSDRIQVSGLHGGACKALRRPAVSHRDNMKETHEIESLSVACRLKGSTMVLRDLAFDPRITDMRRVCSASGRRPVLTHLEAFPGSSPAELKKSNAKGILPL